MKDIVVTENDIMKQEVYWTLKSKVNLLKKELGENQLMHGHNVILNNIDQIEPAKDAGLAEIDAAIKASEFFISLINEEYYGCSANTQSLLREINSLLKKRRSLI